MKFAISRNSAAAPRIDVHRCESLRGAADALARRGRGDRATADLLDEVRRPGDVILVDAVGVVDAGEFRSGGGVGIQRDRNGE